MHMMSIVEQSCDYIQGNVAVSANYEVVHERMKAGSLLNRSFQPREKHPLKTRDSEVCLWWEKMLG
jgi:hypothetical protein